MTHRILVVDDEPRYVRLMEANLISEGYDVIRAYDGQKAVEIVAEKYEATFTTTLEDEEPRRE